MQDKKFKQQLNQLDELIARMDQIEDPGLRADIQQLVQSLMDLHGAGLDRMMELVVQNGGEQGEKLIEDFGKDEFVGNLLLLYGLHPDDLETRVRKALDKVRPYLRSHGGNVELVELANGTVHLRMQGNCHGCPSSAMTLKLAIEEAIFEAAPDVMDVRTEGVQEPRPTSAFVPLEKVHLSESAHSSNTNGGWKEIQDLDSLDHGTIRTVELNGRLVLFCRVGSDFYAYDGKCPGCKASLESASLQASSIVCKSCSQHFDVIQAGRGKDQPELHLEPFPLLMEPGHARVALPSIHS
jgi:Fe-S cluster biogenesis protein NfuA